MSIPNWGLLAKSQIDNETIEEAIDRLVVVHEADEAAHLGVGDSLQSHKASEIIDHLALSVVNDKLKEIIRTYTAIVSGADEDFQNLQEAIDYVESVGGGSILVANGNWTLTEKIVIADNISIYGQSRDGVKLLCDPVNYIVGTALFTNFEYTTGSATFTNGSAVVSGVGTNWVVSGLVPGDTIYLNSDEVEYTILSVNSATQITLTAVYGEPGGSGAYTAFRRVGGSKKVYGTGTQWLTAKLKAGDTIKLNADASIVKIASVESETELTLLEDYNDVGGSGAYTAIKYPCLTAGDLNHQYGSGTITATGGSKIITGSGTTFVGNVVAGDYISIFDVLYKIYVVNSNTQLTLVEYYKGGTYSGLSYIAGSFTKNIVLENFTINNENSNFGAIYLRQTKDSKVSNVIVNQSRGIIMYYCYNVILQHSDSSNNQVNSTSSGLRFEGCVNCNILYNTFNNNSFMGMYSQAMRSQNSIMGNVCNSNGASGMSLAGFGSNAGLGNTIMGNNCSGNMEYGLSLMDCDFSQVVGNVTNLNTLCGILISSTNNIIVANNASYGNLVDGIRIGGTYVESENVISNNVCKSNIGKGIWIKAGSVKNVVVSNVCMLNGVNLLDNGTSTELGHNITV